MVEEKNLSSFVISSFPLECGYSVMPLAESRLLCENVKKDDNSQDRHPSPSAKGRPAAAIVGLSKAR